MSNSKDKFTIDLSSRGIFTFEPKTDLEKTAIEYVQLILHLEEVTYENKFGSKMIQQIRNSKLETLINGVISSATQSDGSGPKDGLIRYTPPEIAEASKSLSDHIRTT